MQVTYDKEQTHFCLRSTFGHWLVNIFRFYSNTIYDVDRKKKVEIKTIFTSVTGTFKPSAIL